MICDDSGETLRPCVTRRSGGTFDAYLPMMAVIRLFSPAEVSAQTDTRGTNPQSAPAAT
ncbi:hypothetical protein AA105894_2739 [Asaia spathodeae NBRC 105894]|nr:hypothetical protein AA105894_2739 [Asaia spathodeae NBRC 105894]